VPLKMKCPYQISKVVNTRLALLEIYASYTVEDITLTVDLPLKAISTITVFCVDRALIYV